MKPFEEFLERECILYDRDAVPAPDALSFDPRTLARRQALLGAASGRGTTYFIRIAGRDCVLRHYHRGGLAAAFLKDTYLWTGIRRTRAWREWRMLERLHGWRLPVPRPIAARVARRGLFYKADIIVERIVGARTLTEAIRESALGEERWRAIGRCLRRFHDAGVHHPDVTGDNILLGRNGSVYLIDFDNCALRRPSAWRRRNLARLYRFLVKRRSLYEGFHFAERDWQILCEGYATGDGP